MLLLLLFDLAGVRWSVMIGRVMMIMLMLAARPELALEPRRRDAALLRLGLGAPADRDSIRRSLRRRAPEFALEGRAEQLREAVRRLEVRLGAPRRLRLRLLDFALAR